MASSQAVRGLASTEVCFHVITLLEKGLVEFNGSSNFTYQGENCVKLLYDYDYDYDYDYEKVKNIFEMEAKIKRT